jgi:hypothetical protein
LGSHAAIGTKVAHTDGFTIAVDVTGVKGMLADWTTTNFNLYRKAWGNLELNVDHAVLLNSVQCTLYILTVTIRYRAFKPS